MATQLPPEINDHARQTFLQKRARQCARDLSMRNGILGVLLSGSVARGPVHKGSDLDLHVVVSNQTMSTIPAWTFHRAQCIENVHTVPWEVLMAAWDSLDEPEKLAVWFYKTRLGDELQGCQSLFWSDSSLHSKLLEVLEKRKDPDVTTRLVRLFVSDADRLLHEATAALQDRAILDAHQNLRWAVQSLLIAAMIRRGWFIRGSKKRIEIALSFLPDRILQTILTLAITIVGLMDFTQTLAAEISQMRLEFRVLLQQELIKLYEDYRNFGVPAQRLETAIKQTAQHNRDSFDYYLPLIETGMFLGPINHIRALSGFPSAPRSLLTCIDKPFRWPVHSFLDAVEFSQIIRDSWLQIAKLNQNARQIQAWITELNATAGALSDG
jgi:nucleotidyltransferase-like protein